MKTFSAIALLVAIAVSVSVMFVGDKWATSIPEVASCCIAALWMLYFATGRGEPRWSPALWVVGGVLLWSFAQILLGWTVYQWQTNLSILYWLGNFSVLFAAIQSFDDVRVRERWLRGLAVFGFVVGIVSSLQALTTNSTVYGLFETKYAGWVVMGPFVYHNQYAAFVELVLPVAIYIALTDKSWKWFYLLVAAILYASVFVAGSRAGFFLTTLELVLVPVVLVRSRKLALAGVFSGLGLLVCMVVLLAFSAGPDYLLQRFKIRDPYAIRREFLYSSLQMFRNRPGKGVGLGNWATAYPAHALFDDGSYANQAHNDWAQWAVEGGTPLLIIMLGLVVWVFPRAVRTGWGLGGAALFLHCFVDYPIQRPAVALVFFCDHRIAIRRAFAFKCKNAMGKAIIFQEPRQRWVSALNRLLKAVPDSILKYLSVTVPAQSRHNGVKHAVALPNPQSATPNYGASLSYHTFLVNSNKIFLP